MTATRTAVHLYNVARREPEAGELWDAITEQQLADWESEWRPKPSNALQRLSRAGVERREWPQDLHWDWRKKVDVLQGMLANPGFSIVCDDLTQGMMIVDMVKYRSRINA